MIDISQIPIGNSTFSATTCVEPSFNLTFKAQWGLLSANQERVELDKQLEGGLV